VYKQTKLSNRATHLPKLEIISETISSASTVLQKAIGHFINSRTPLLCKKFTPSCTLAAAKGAIFVSCVFIASWNDGNKTITDAACASEIHSMKINRFEVNIWQLFSQ
jgi:hypothetical protein